MSNIVAYEADTDGFVVLGSRVIVYTMSGRVVLALTTEQDNSISELTDYCFRKCAANEAMPQVCVSLSIYLYRSSWQTQYQPTAYMCLVSRVYVYSLG